MNLSERFLQLQAPQGFKPDWGVPLRWMPEHQKFMVIFDPSCNTGFVLRMHKKEDEVAFHLDGRIARMIHSGQVITDSSEQEKVLSDWLTEKVA